MKQETFGTAFLALMVLAIAFLHSTHTLDPGLIRFIGLAAFCLILTGAWLVQIFNTKKEKRKIHPVIVLYGIFVIYLSFRISPAFVLGDAFFEWLKSALLFVMIYTIFKVYRSNTLRTALTWSLSVSGLILSVWGFYELITLVSNKHFVIPFSTYDIKTCFEHRNLFTQVLFLSLPFQILQILSKNKKITLVVFSFSSILSLFMIIILSNRAVWLSTLFALIVFAIIVWILYKKEEQILSFRQITYMLSILGLAVILAMAFISLNKSETEMKSHSEEIFDPGKGTIHERIGLWERTIEMSKTNPLFGIGLTNWKIEILRFSNDGLVSEDHVTFYQRPHNDYLWILSETGIIGLLLYLLFVGWTMILAIRLLLKKDQTQKLFLIAVVTSLSGYLVFAFFSFPRERVFHQTILFLLISSILMVDSETWKAKPVSKSGKYFSILISSVFLVTIGGAIRVGSIHFRGESNLRKALEAKSKFDYQLLIAGIEQASHPLYQMDPTSTPLRWYSGFAYYKLNQPQKAKEQFLKAYQYNPYHIHVLNNLASAYSVLGQPDSAIYYYKKAVIYAPNFDESWFNMSAVYFNSKQYDQSYEALKKVNLFTTDKRYRPFIKTILSAMIREEMSKSQPGIPYVLPDDEGWYFEIHKKLRNEHIPLKKLIFEDQILTQENLK